MGKPSLVLAICLALAALTGCEDPGDTELPFVTPLPDKRSVNNRIVRVACYIDTEHNNPLNAGDYTLESGIPWFDLVILGAARIKKDERGVYLYCPENLRRLLDRNRSHIRPLQRNGIKVLLGVSGGGDDVSFGSLDKYEITVFARDLRDAVQSWGLDGADFYDIDAGSAVYPPDIPYDGPAEERAEWEENLWKKGGDSMNNLVYAFRQLLGGYDSVDKYITVREVNYSRYFPRVVSAATFSGTAEQFNYSITVSYTEFAPDTNIVDDQLQPIIYHSQYCPLAVNLGGDAGTGTVMPPLWDGGGTDIETVSRLVIDPVSGGGDYGLIYYHNLKPVSQAAAEPYLLDTRPGAAAGSRLSQAEYMSITSLAVFNKVVQCRGGDHPKDW